ncbi:MAG: hypothetical protein HYT37_03160 [Candidatus Sungbacteria bacterium]|nr:hypothetical protein [Candidatus Sungbacteria bacterium]
MSSVEKKYRLQVDFGEEPYIELCVLEKQSGNTSKADVISDALGVYKWALKEVRAGSRILIERKKDDGQKETEEVEFPFIKSKL